MQTLALMDSKKNGIVVGGLLLLVCVILDELKFFNAMTNNKTAISQRQRSDITSNCGLTTSLFLRDCYGPLLGLASRLGCVAAPTAPQVLDARQSALLSDTLALLAASTSFAHNAVAVATYLVASLHDDSALGAHAVSALIILFFKNNSN